MNTVLYGYYGGYGFYFDWTILLILLGAAICGIASAYMKSVTSKYARIQASSGLTGREVAERILRTAGIYDVAVRPISGNLTDHYDPRNKTVNLGQESYRSTSLTGIGVAAHEVGHAIQDATGYSMLRIRGSLVPAVNIGAQLSWPVFILGLMFQLQPLMQAGIILFSMAVLFQLVTLPVEIDASRRALQMLRQTGIVREEEYSATRKVLTAAAMTYVAALLSTILQLLRLLILARGNRRDD